MAIVYCKCIKPNLNDNNIFCTSCGSRLKLSPQQEYSLFPLKFPEELKFPKPPFYITPDICEYVIARDILWIYLHQVSLWRMLVLTFLSDLPEREKANYSNYPYIKLSDRTHYQFISWLQNSKQRGCFPQIIFEAENTSLIEAVMDIFSWRSGIIAWLMDGRHSAGSDLNDRDWYYVGQFMNYEDVGHICELCFTNHLDGSRCMFAFLIT